MNKIQTYTRRVGWRTRPLAGKRGGLPLCICETEHHDCKVLELTVQRAGRSLRVRLPSTKDRATLLSTLIEMRDLFTAVCPPAVVVVRGHKRRERAR